MNLLILGATGMAGHVIALYLSEAGHQVTTFSRRKFDYCKNIIGDIRDYQVLQEVIDSRNYDAVINAVGLLNQDAQDHQSDAVLLNSFLPHYLSEITRDKKTRIIHMSTDCVFSGNKGQYQETSLRDGSSFYDRSKALGEIDDEKNLTFRNSIIGPDCNKNGIGLLNWFLQQEGVIKGYTKAIWTGVTTVTLAKAMEQALKENLTGLYHLVNNQTISKYELLMLCNHHLKNSKLTIIPDENVSLDKSLVNNRTDFSFQVPSYEEMIIELKQWMQAHQSLYPHYPINELIFEE